MDNRSHLYLNHKDKRTDLKRPEAAEPLEDPPGTPVALVPSILGWSIVRVPPDPPWLPIHVGLSDDNLYSLALELATAAPSKIGS